MPALVSGHGWVVAFDSTVVRAHQHAAGARHQPPQDVPAHVLAVALAEDLTEAVAAESGTVSASADHTRAGSNHTNPQPGQGKPSDLEGLGGSRGGLSTKIHLIADTRVATDEYATVSSRPHGGWLRLIESAQELRHRGSPPLRRQLRFLQPSRAPRDASEPPPRRANPKLVAAAPV